MSDSVADCEELRVVNEEVGGAFLVFIFDKGWRRKPAESMMAYCCML